MRPFVNLPDLIRFSESSRSSQKRIPLILFENEMRISTKHLFFFSANRWVLLLAFLAGLIPSLALAQSQTLTEEEFTQIILKKGWSLSQAEQHLQVLRSQLQSTTSLFPTPLEFELGYETGSPFNDGDRVSRFDVSQQIDLFGKLTLEKQSALADIEQTELQIIQNKRDFLRNARIFFINAYILKEKVRYSDSALEFAARLQNNAKIRLEKGDISLFEENGVILEFLKEKSQHEILTGELASALISLSSRYDLVLSSTTFLPTENFAGVSFLSINPEKSNEYIDSLPEMQLQLNGLKKLQITRDLLSKEKIPNPILGLSLTNTITEFGQKDFTGDPSIINGVSGIRKNDKSLGLKLNFALPFSIPLLWESKKFATLPVEGAIASKKSELVLLRVLLTSEIESAFKRIQSVDSALQILRSSMPALDQNYHALEKAYAAGQISFSDFLVNKKAITEMRQLQFDAEKRYHDLRIELLFLLNK